MVHRVQYNVTMAYAFYPSTCSMKNCIFSFGFCSWLLAGSSFCTALLAVSSCLAGTSANRFCVSTFFHQEKIWGKDCVEYWIWQVSVTGWCFIWLQKTLIGWFLPRWWRVSNTLIMIMTLSRWTLKTKDLRNLRRGTIVMIVHPVWRRRKNGSLLNLWVLFPSSMINNMPKPLVAHLNK